MNGQEGPVTTLFEAVVVPHRSLSPRGLRILIGAICGLTGLMALRFSLIGAWPVAAFGAIEVGLAVFLLRLNARRGRETELILLSTAGLTVVQTDVKGRRKEQRLAADWLNVILRDRPGRTPALLLALRGTELEIGACLGDAEKRSLAAALQEALESWRNPRFDNPQLRES